VTTRVGAGRTTPPRRRRRDETDASPDAGVAAESPASGIDYIALDIHPG